LSVIIENQNAMTNNILIKYTCEISKIESSKDFPEYFWVGNTIDGNIPILLPFKQSKGFIYDIGVNVENLAKIHQAMEILALKSLLSVSNNLLKVTVIDIGFGATFQNLKKLNRNNVSIEFVTEQNQLDKFLIQITNTAKDIESNIISQQGLTHISEFNVYSKVPKPYNLILIPNFPIGINNQQIEKIKDLMLYANKCGYIFVLGFLHSEVRKLIEKSYSSFDFSVFTQNMQRINIVAENKNALYNISLNIIELITNRGYNHLQISENIINEAINLTNSKFTKEEKTFENKDFLNIPIGYDENGNRQFFSLGQTSSAYHTLVSGTTGSGKTTFTHNLILQLAEKYNSDQIRLYLFDYKESIEFDRYREHPNVELLHLDNDNYDVVINTLKGFVSEIKTRKELFNEIKVSDIYNYNKKSKNQIHYKIMIIDEFHRIFKTDPQKGKEIANQLELVATSGRAWGLHLIIISQTLNIDRLYEFRGQFQVRIGFRHEENKDTIPLGINKDFTKIEPFQMYYRSANKVIFVPKLDFIEQSVDEIQLKLAEFKNQHKIINNFTRKIIEPNAQLSNDKSDENKKDIKKKDLIAERENKNG